MPYSSLGSCQPNTATADTTGTNSGNFTNAMTADAMGVSVQVFECYHITVNNVPPGFSAQININNRPYSFTTPFGGSEWDPSQTMKLRSGDEVDFLWNISATSGLSAPQVTMYFQYDPTIRENQMGGGGL